MKTPVKTPRANLGRKGTGWRKLRKDELLKATDEFKRKVPIDIDPSPGWVKIGRRTLRDEKASHWPYFHFRRRAARSKGKK